LYCFTRYRHGDDGDGLTVNCCTSAHRSSDKSSSPADITGQTSIARRRYPYYLRGTMRYFGGVCVFVVFVTAHLLRCRAHPVPAEGGDSEDGYHFREDYPDALQITCTAPVRLTPCATGPADRKPRRRPADRPGTRCPRPVFAPRDDTSI